MNQSLGLLRADDFLSECVLLSGLAKVVSLLSKINEGVRKRDLSACLIELLQYACENERAGACASMTSPAVHDSSLIFSFLAYIEGDKSLNETVESSKLFRGCWSVKVRPSTEVVKSDIRSLNNSTLSLIVQSDSELVLDESFADLISLD